MSPPPPLSSTTRVLKAINYGCLCGCDEDGGGLGEILQRTDPALPVVVELNGATDLSMMLNSGDPAFRMFNLVGLDCAVCSFYPSFSSSPHRHCHPPLRRL